MTRRILPLLALAAIAACDSPTAPSGTSDASLDQVSPDEYELHIAATPRAEAPYTGQTLTAGTYHIRLERKDDAWEGNAPNSVASPGVDSVVFVVDGQRFRRERLHPFEAPPVTFDDGNHTVRWIVYGPAYATETVTVNVGSSAPPAPVPEVEAVFDLHVGTTRLADARYDGEALPPGHYYIRLERADGQWSSSTAGVDSVVFTVDGKRNRERYYPYEARPVNWSSGDHTVAWSIFGDDPASDAVTIQVGNSPAPEPDPTPAPEPDPTPDPTPAPDPDPTPAPDPDPTPAPDPTPDPTVDGVRVAPGQNIQSIVDSQPAGTTFIIGSGVHYRQQIRPRNGDSFVGEAGAVLDGQSSTAWAIRGTADDVTIRGLEIRNYSVETQRGVVAAGWNDGHRWVIEDNNIHHNSGGAGLEVGPQMQVRGNRFHHNGQFGVTGWGNGALIENNEIDNNNTERHDVYWAAGGTKFFYSQGLVFRSNYVHHNYGFGIWFDHDNGGTVIENNRSEDNVYAGIYYEVNRDGVIRNNQVRRNGVGTTGTWSTAGITISESANTEVYGNTLSGNGNGIMAVQQDRSSVARGPWHVENLWVHDNDITQTSSGGSGMRDIIGDGRIYNRNNRFNNNTYRISGNSQPFWRNSRVSESTWKNSGQDANSTFIR